MDHVAGGSAESVRVIETPQLERLLRACPPRVHPRGRVSPDPSPDAISPRHPRPRLLSTVRAFPPTCVVLCRLLTSAGRSERIPPPSVPGRDTPADLPRSAVIPSAHRRRMYQVRPVVDGGLRGGVPTRPDRTTPHIRFVSLAPHLRSTLSSDPTSR
jgi:hypothetical protein